MSLVRPAILWMAGNSWMRKTLPQMAFARRAVRRFLPGEDQESVLTAATVLADRGIDSVLTRLGENVVSAAEAQAVVTDYLRLLAEIDRQMLNAEISVKLTQLGLDVADELAESNVCQLACRAARTDKGIWIDMEGSAYTERTISLYERVKQIHGATGICLQSYLLRSAADIRRLLALSPAIRLVKGAYAEPREVAYRGRDIDTNFANLARLLLDRKAQDDQIRVVLGTHDLRLIDQAGAYARSIGLPTSAFEVHMLYGVRADEQERLAAAGYPVRTLISYGKAWYAWYMRRLAERPANMVFALRQLIP